MHRFDDDILNNINSYNEAILRINTSEHPGIYDENHPYFSQKHIEKVYRAREKKTVKEIASMLQPNSKGYRCDEFVEPRDFIFAGCSFTYGHGVVKEGIWGNIVSERLGLKSYNLGKTGRSTASIINEIFNYCRIYGNPKIIMCLFPDFLRKELYVNKNNISANFHSDDDVQIVDLLLTRQEEMKYSKKPHEIVNIYPKEAAIVEAIRMIKILEMYCNTNNIKLLWSTWEEGQMDMISKNLSKFNNFKNFVKLNLNGWHAHKEDDMMERFHDNADGQQCHKTNSNPCNTYTDCHSDLREIYGSNFDIPFDRDLDSTEGRSHGHLGVHVHVHWAESFLKALEAYDERNLV
jgi:hypothetical protein